MKKNGFTLIELLAVITVLAVIVTVSYYTVNGITESIKESMWENKVSLIESAAVRWGENNEYLLESKGYTTEANATTVEVQTLIDRGFLTTEERDGERKIVTKEIDGQKIEVNNKTVKVWLEKKNVYAKYVE